MTPTFLVEPTGFASVALHRYSRTSDCTAPRGFGYHQAFNPIGTVPCHLERDSDDRRRYWRYDGVPDPPHNDPRWPTVCACGYAFGAEDAFQVFTRAQYRRVGSDGATFDLQDAPPGAMYWSEWIACPHEPPCERHLFAVCPNGRTWDIDSRCSNCTKPEDRIHRCWVRTGEPPMVTVGKGGVTCAAGGGSIQAGDYHGFLRDGVFT